MKQFSLRSNLILIKERLLQKAILRDKLSLSYVSSKTEGTQDIFKYINKLKRKVNFFYKMIPLFPHFKDLKMTNTGVWSRVFENFRLLKCSTMS